MKIYIRYINIVLHICMTYTNKTYKNALNISRINVDQSPKFVDLHWWCKCVAVGIKASHKARNLKYASWQNWNKDFKENDISNHQSFSVLCWMAFIQSRHLCQISTLVDFWLCYAFVGLYHFYLWDAVTAYWCWWCSGQGNLHHRPTSNTLATKTNNCKLD